MFNTIFENRDYLYPSRTKIIEKLASPWDKYEQISDMDDQIKENIVKLSTEQSRSLNNGFIIVFTSK